MLENVIKDWGGVEVYPMDVYTDVFHLGEGYIQKENEPSGRYKANPIGYWKNDKEEHGHFRILFEDTFEEVLGELQRADFGLLNGITYFGRRRDQNHASKMYAMIFDYDDIDDRTLLNFFSGAINADIYPLPNYIILSGSNAHLYYLFEEPIDLYPYMKIQLKSLKYALTEKMCNPLTTLVDEGVKSQKQGIFQPFRVIGGHTKTDSVETVVRAFRLNTHPYSIELLNRYVPETYRVDASKLFKESKCTLEQAKKKYPKWYEKVIMNHDRTPRKWDIQDKVHGDNPIALYDWWLKLLEDGATFHHRYFGIMCLAIYGAKVSVPFEKVKADAYSLIPMMNAISPDNPFTEDDVESALECYDDKYCTFPIKDIAAISGIDIPRNKRNGRSQEKHLQGARAIRDINNENWREGNGRKSKANLVHEWQKNNPDGTKADCHRETKIDPKTIRRWWLDDRERMKEIALDRNPSAKRLMTYAEELGKLKKS